MQTDRDWAKAKFNFSKTAPDYFFSTVPKEFFKLQHIDSLINWRSPTFGSPMGGPIRIDKAMSERKISEELKKHWNENVSCVSLHYLLPELGYSKMVNQKEKQVGSESPWRNNQFLYIAEISQLFMDAGDPIISIDTKKKEKVGEFKPYLLNFRVH